MRQGEAEAAGREVGGRDGMRDSGGCGGGGGDAALEGRGGLPARPRRTGRRCGQPCHGLGAREANARPQKREAAQCPADGVRRAFQGARGLNRCPITPPRLTRILRRRRGLGRGGAGVRGDAGAAPRDAGGGPQDTRPQARPRLRTPRRPHPTPGHTPPPRPPHTRTPHTRTPHHVLPLPTRTPHGPPPAIYRRTCTPPPDASHPPRHAPVRARPRPASARAFASPAPRPSPRTWCERTLGGRALWGGGKWGGSIHHPHVCV